MQRITLQDNREIHFQIATENDIGGIISLYDSVYKGSYTLKDVQDPAIIRKKIENPNFFWTLAHEHQRVIGSVIFAIDPLNKIGKCYAAAVLPEFRGQDVMRTMVLHGLERLTSRTRLCDVIYATTRTTSVAPALVLEHLGFQSMGIFPNVRKVKSFETHGLEVFFRDGCFDLRRSPPLLVPEVAEFYNIVSEVLGLPGHQSIDLPLSDPRQMGEPMVFIVERDEIKVLETFDRYQDHDLMNKVFFPFIDPNLLFSSEDGKAEIFVNFNEMDGNGVIVAYRIEIDDLRRVLMWFCEAASQVGMRYIELLISAYRPELQRAAIDARFLPNAYFPAMRWTENNRREDYVAFSRSFERLDFMDLHLVDTNRRYLDAFMKCWYEMLVRCQPDFDEEWRLG
ncbi:MAG: GNAT family N-acetyltransferase [Candidatus Riflebacteria bacterium]|nr:GNAT family N-acetyltransferase [Candidatus Riflebacteria bacterium]